MKTKIRLIFLIGSLSSGGKERRLIELLRYLKKQERYEILVVLAFDTIKYTDFFELDIPYKIIHKKKDYKDPSLFFKINKICREFNPDIIHTWSNMLTFYVLPVAKYYKIPLVNSQITSAKKGDSLFSIPHIAARFNLKYSDIVTSNSLAGLSSYNYYQNGKYRVVYNGINMQRFQNLPLRSIIKKRFGLYTKYALVMAASFSDNKDYGRYISICNIIERKRNDITFYAVGDGNNLSLMKDRAKTENIRNIRFTGYINNIEELISICDIGILMTNSSIHGEGISNSLLEYMALGKPVIANDAGGTKEIVTNNWNGYLFRNETNEEIADKIIELIDNKAKREAFGKNSKVIIDRYFTIDIMGTSFEKLYHDLAPDKFNKNIMNYATSSST